MVSTRGSLKVLSGAAFALAVAVVAVAFLAPVYSSGETLSDTTGDLLILALALGVALTLIPVVVPATAKRTTFWVCGSILVLSSFVTVLGVFFIPAGLLLMICGGLVPKHSR